MANPKGGPNKFKRGTSGNPAGRPADPPELKALKKLNREEFEKITNEVIHLNVRDLRELSESDTENAIKVMLAEVLLHGIDSGDYLRANFFLNRLIGKVPERFEGSNGEPINFVSLVQLAGKKAA